MTLRLVLSKLFNGCVTREKYEKGLEDILRVLRQLKKFIYFQF